MNEHMREDLIRMVELPDSEMQVRADDSGDGRLLVGYPVVFNTWTEISGWEGNFVERIDPGALTKTLKERGDQVKVLFNHGLDPHIGEKPLGKPRTMSTDDRGLYVEVPLARTSYNEDLIELLRSGALDGMSFRFSVLRDEWVEQPKVSKLNPKALPERTITELRLYEVGPVTFPAYQATSAGVRARAREAFLAWRNNSFLDSDADHVTSEEDIDAPPIEAPVEDTRQVEKPVSPYTQLRHRVQDTMERVRL